MPTETVLPPNWTDLQLNAVAKLTLAGMALATCSNTVTHIDTPVSMDGALHELGEVTDRMCVATEALVLLSRAMAKANTPHPCSTRPVPASVQEQRKSGVELAAIALAKDAAARMANGVPEPLDLRIADHPRDVPGIPAGHNGTEGELLSEGERPAILSQ